MNRMHTRQWTGWRTRVFRILSPPFIERVAHRAAPAVAPPCSGVPRTIYVAHITRVEYGLFLDGLSLDSWLPASYETWMDETRALHVHYRKSGFRTEPVITSWHGFFSHARRNGMSPTYALLTVYANQLGWLHTARQDG